MLLHPPKPIYPLNIVIRALSDDIDRILSFNDNSVIIVAGDINKLNTDFLELNYGLVQLVHQPTHGKNTLDFFCSRPDIFMATVFKSLIKTKHQAVMVTE